MTQTPKVEKKETPHWKCTCGGMPITSVSKFDYDHLQYNFNCLEKDYRSKVTALETALKAARDLIADDDTQIDNTILFDVYFDAMEKVDVK